MIEPKAGYPQAFDRDYVVFLSDWTDENPHTVMGNLKFQADYYNRQQRTLGTFVQDVSRQGLAATVSDRLMWGEMRMSPTDILDINGSTYTYLINGQPPASNWTALFRPGERVRLRFINGSAMSIFDVRIPDLPMTIVQADGIDVRPVTVDQFRIGTAETYDVIVEPREDRAFTLFVQAEDRSGFARATLAPRRRDGGACSAARSAADAHHGRYGHGARVNGRHADGSRRDERHAAMPGRDARPQPRSPPPFTASRRNAMRAAGMAGRGHAGARARRQYRHGQRLHSPPTYLEGQVGVDNVAMMTMSRIDDPGAGFPPGRRVLRYTDLQALTPARDSRPPSRDIVLHLTGNMERFMWGFDGKKYSEAPEPIVLRYGERVRFVLINDTMMEHPMHLHGMFSELENGHGEYRPLKHTVLVKPAEQVSFLVTADAYGRWAFHCHLLFHMEAGMFREVRVI